MREDFLAITTIGINFIVEALFRYVPFFGGALGIGGIPRIVLFELRMKGEAFLLLSVGFLVDLMVVCWWLTRSWAGLACFALREEETAAATLGISPVRFKLLAFVIGTAMAGLWAAPFTPTSCASSRPPISHSPLSVALSEHDRPGRHGDALGARFSELSSSGSCPRSSGRWSTTAFFFYTLLLLLMIRFQPGGLLGEDSAARRVLAPLFRGGGHERALLALRACRNTSAGSGPWTA